MPVRMHGGQPWSNSKGRQRMCTRLEAPEQQCGTAVHWQPLKSPGAVVRKGRGRIDVPAWRISKGQQHTCRGPQEHTEVDVRAKVQ